MADGLAFGDLQPTSARIAQVKSVRLSGVHPHIDATVGAARAAAQNSAKIGHNDTSSAACH
jgi:hypothetical protein